ncbi:helix-turn-helix transcriptional regulator [Aestuariicella hydrocarbonica]|uniref:Helix-turn-helix transcriptional regulator n=1 Tax=Pseudomaricurvus hydrocarbonicus TaxID=1470433 RepID=A0A9E5MQ61_9GAMM|nr:helix-turn-helix transcriptional regulator [Aestuariicella hydrocarbonica]NHO68381.1 helix-turn-helix transcriptional regulator [Aestuariicella hydrocarbonica]
MKRHFVLPKHIRTVMCFLKSHTNEPICVDDLAHISGTSTRSLYLHFKNFLGMTPMEYVKELRMERVRNELLSGDANNIYKAATNAGFNHMGRFSRDYRQRYGENPRETLKARMFQEE